MYLLTDYEEKINLPGYLHKQWLRAAPVIAWLMVIVVLGVEAKPGMQDSSALGKTAAGKTGWILPGDRLVTQADQGTEVQLEAGQVLALRLPVNPSTGYRWIVSAMDTNVLYAVDGGHFETSSGRIGAAGMQILRFAPRSAGKIRLALEVRRSWETQGDALGVFDLQVIVPAPAPEPSRVDRTKIASKTIPLETDVPFTTSNAPGKAAPEPTKTLPARGLFASFIQTYSKTSLAAHFNWCEQGGCTPIRDQGNCGSCWAFSTVGAFESNLKIKDNQERDLSEQYLLSCNTDGYSCNGGWYAHDYHEWRIPPGELAAGAVNESDFPYQAIQIACQPPHPHQEQIESWAYLASNAVPPAEQMKQAIQQYGPLATSICIGPAFQSYSGGIFNVDEAAECGLGYVNHGIVIVGWDDVQGVWYLRNSWGPWWGEAGYMRIQYGISNAGYAATFVVYSGNNATPTVTPTATATLTPTPTITPTPTATPVGPPIPRLYLPAVWASPPNHR